MHSFERSAELVGEGRRAGERGAVAVMVGLFMLILCAAGAFGDRRGQLVSPVVADAEGR